MQVPFWSTAAKPLTGHSRREFFRRGALATATLALGGRIRRAVAAPLEYGANLYRSIGVKTLINAKGTYTIISGSQTLPEVKRAMDDASRSYVQMDELMDGVGRRLAELTGAEWGIVTAGCCAALTHCTAACIAGSNPERMQHLPNLEGLKSEVVIPAYSRNVYDHAIRMLGVKIVTVRDASELESAFNERTAMAYILGGPQDDGPLGTRIVAEAAKRYSVPVIVDAAAEVLTIPNVHLQRGATAVAYSGGKCIRGPQAAGLLLGERNLLQAAWANSAPHHAYGRSLKVGKEEIMGMLAAVEMWVKRDHQAETKLWESWLETISASLKQIDGVTMRINQASTELSNQTPTLSIQWDGARLGITGQELSRLLLDTEPRVVLASAGGSRPGNMSSSASIVPYMLIPGDEKVIGKRLYAALSSPPKFENPAPPPEGQPAAVAGQWELKLEFDRGSATHSLFLEQQGTRLFGTHRGEFYSGDLNGTVAENTVRFQSSHQAEGTRLSYNFTGTADGDTMAGKVNMDEYGEALWRAQRHEYRAGGRRSR
jgi:L-seryl-tRNA(Ser) seleniumtransferase